MEALRSIEQRIEEGFVLSDQGRWMHMAELRIYEKRVIEQLSKGNVLVDGKWIHMEEAKRHARAARAAQMVAFEATQNMLETVCITMPSAKPSEPDVTVAETRINNVKPDIAIADFSGGDDMRETAFLTIERAKSQPPAAPENPPKVDDAGSTANKRDLSAEVNGVLLLGLSRSAAAEQSKYAMEYIEEFNYTKKRRGLANFFAGAAVFLAIAAAVAVIVLQNFG
jgi:hypothetical protein